MDLPPLNPELQAKIDAMKARAAAKEAKAKARKEAKALRLREKKKAARKLTRERARERAKVRARAKREKEKEKAKLRRQRIKAKSKPRGPTEHALKLSFGAFLRQHGRLPNEAEQELIKTKRSLREIRMSTEEAARLATREKRRNRTRYAKLLKERRKLDHEMRREYEQLRAEITEAWHSISLANTLLKESITAHEKKVTEVRQKAFAEGLNQGLADGRRSVLEEQARAAASQARSAPQPQPISEPTMMFPKEYR